MLIINSVTMEIIKSAAIEGTTKSAILKANADKVIHEDKVNQYDDIGDTYVFGDKEYWECELEVVPEITADKVKNRFRWYDQNTELAGWNFSIHKCTAVHPVSGKRQKGFFCVSRDMIEAFVVFGETSPDSNDTEESWIDSFSADDISEDDETIKTARPNGCIFQGFLVK